MHHRGIGGIPIARDKNVAFGIQGSILGGIGIMPASRSQNVPEVGPIPVVALHDDTVSIVRSCSAGIERLAQDPVAEAGLPSVAAVDKVTPEVRSPVTLPEVHGARSMLVGGFYLPGRRDGVLGIVNKIVPENVAAGSGRHGTGFGYRIENIILN